MGMDKISPGTGALIILSNPIRRWESARVKCECAWYGSANEDWRLTGAALRCVIQNFLAYFRALACVIFLRKTTQEPCVACVELRASFGNGTLVATLPDGPLFRDIAFRRCAKFVRIYAIITGMAVKVNFRMAAAAILDFVESEFLHQNRLWDTVFSPFAILHANIG